MYNSGSQLKGKNFRAMSSMTATSSKLMQSHLDSHFEAFCGIG
jgi:hypothetical protein